MSERQFEDAVAYFNRAGQSGMDDIRYTYDSDKRILIQHHKSAISQSNEITGHILGSSIATVFAVSSTYDAIDSGNWSADGPDWSLGFLLLFGALGIAHKKRKDSIVKAVDRNVQADKQSQNTPIL